MFNIGGGEMLVLAILALLVFGPEGLPDIIKTAMRTIRALRQAATDIQTEVSTALTVETRKQEGDQRRRRRSAPLETTVPEAEGSGEGAGAQDFASNTGTLGEVTPVKVFPIADTPVVQTPAVQTPAVETAVVETPAVETATVEIPVVVTSDESPSSMEPVVSPTVPLASPPVASLAEDDDDDGPGVPMVRPVRSAPQEPEGEIAAVPDGEARVGPF